MLRQARHQAERAETLLLAGDIAARMSDRKDRDAATTRVMRAQVEATLSAQELASAREALASLIAGDGLAMAVQPIVDVRNGAVHAYEALARSPAT
ncbi:MAG TPA: hypothetical protein VK790_00365 [Solirubrobacteraceae bacterium]|jgi:predicted signal transduction protein with EAL and GGDEF domain|nr:hypothetical protein [Solirubrobacteraceae bacterium]